MICQRCGFEMEEGQTFCSMCGTEQSRAKREKKKSFKSILWVIKVTSKPHLKMWLVFLMSIVMFACVLAFMDTTLPLVISSICLNIVLLAYELLYVLIPYKNPNAGKTKAYKIKFKMCAVCAILLLVATVFLNFENLAAAIHGFIISNR